jgi:hypothetical protein
LIAHRFRSLQDVSLMYLSRVGSVAYEIGVKADLSNRVTPVRGVGLELRFCS